ncbi:19520_t:CDS:2, partial [Rhizophagus irregularis]
MKEIDKAMKGRFQYKDTELKWVLQQLHRHHHENWRINLDPEKAKKRKDARKDKFNDDCELLMNESEFHSNEVSETDDELAQKEVRELLCLSDSVGNKPCKSFSSPLPPEDAPEWTISRSYNNNDDHQSMIGSGEKENIEN